VAFPPANDNDTSLISPPVTSPDGSLLYLGLSNNTVTAVHCLNISDGNSVWTIPSAQPGPYAAWDGLVYLPRASGPGFGIVAVNGNTGQQVWSAALTLPIWGWPVISAAGETLYTITMSPTGLHGYVVALDARSGRLAWQTAQLPMDVPCFDIVEATLADGSLVFVAIYTTIGSYVYALRSGDGSVAWKQPVTNVPQFNGMVHAASSSTVGGNTFSYLVLAWGELEDGLTQYVRAFDVATGLPGWTVTLAAPSRWNVLASAPAYSALRQLIVIALEPIDALSPQNITVVALDAATGSPIWNSSSIPASALSDTAIPSMAAPALDHDLAYITPCGKTRTIAAVNLASGSMEWLLPLPLGVPASVDSYPQPPLVLDGAVVAALNPAARAQQGTNATAFIAAIMPAAHG
jgi:outer membrane protein assembly factor BamB